MAQKTILYLHGFASSALGTKARFFADKFRAWPEVVYLAVDFNPTPLDFQYMTTSGQIDRLRQYVLDHRLDSFSIIGSSYGGLIALHYAHRFGGVAHQFGGAAHRFGGVEQMLLLAPGVRWIHGGLSDEELAQWERAGVLPVYHPAFEQEISVRYDMQVDGLRYVEPVPPAVPLLIIHGTRDQAVPIEHSRQYAAAFPERVRLIEVDANHDLNAHLEFIWRHARALLVRA